MISVATDLHDFLNPTRAVKAAKIHDSMLVADFGVGGGFFTTALARAVGPRGKVYAIDINRNLLERLAPFAEIEGLKNIEYVQGDLDEPHGSSLPDGALDVVMMANILFQVEKKDMLIQEAFRVLRKGGRLVLIDWKDSFGGMGPHKDHVIPQEKALALAVRGGGFAHLEDINAGTYHYGLILKKR